MTSSTTSTKRCMLLELPVELRTFIYKHLFSSPPPYIRLLCPTRKRLCCSRTSPTNPLPLLQTCRQIRLEAIPFIYGSLPLCFRNAQSAINFIYDPFLDLQARMGISHLALDLGDVIAHDDQKWKVKQEFTRAVEGCLKALPGTLKTVEMRFWCLEGRRKDGYVFTEVVAWFREVQEVMQQIQQVKDEEEGVQIILKFTQLWKELSDDRKMQLPVEGWMLDVQCSQSAYGTGLSEFGRERDEMLRCCTVVLSRNEKFKSCFGKADQAVVDRQKVAGKPSTVAMQMCEATLDDIIERAPTVVPSKRSTLRTPPAPSRRGYQGVCLSAG